VIVDRIKDTRDTFYRPPIPQQEAEGVHPGILALMKQCWAEEPPERPSFNDIIKSLKTINRGKSVCTVLFTARCDASAALAMGLCPSVSVSVSVCLSVCLSVCHKSVFY